MALFPPEFLVGVLVAFFQIRLRAYCSLASFLLKGLKFFLPPEDEMLQQIGAVSSSEQPQSTNGSSKKRSKTSSTAVKELSPDERMERFYVRLGKIDMGMMDQTLFFDLFEMMIVILSSTLVAYLFGETLTCIKLFMGQPVTDTSGTSTTGMKSIEISFYGLFSALLVCLWFPLQIKFAHGFLTYEARLGFGIGFIGFIVSLFVLLAPKNLFDFDMEAAIEDLAKRLLIALSTLGFQKEDFENLSSTGQLGKSILLFNMALLGGIFTCTCFLPAFRFARMYGEMTKEPKTSLMKKFLFHLNMFLPIIVCACWMKSLATDLFVPTDMKPCDSHTLARDCLAIEKTTSKFSFGWKESTWNSTRTGLVVLTFLVRLLCLRDHLQYFLIEIKDAIVTIVRRPGKGPVDGDAIMNKIRIQFNYLPVIAVQYLAPFGGLLAAGLLFKRQTGTTFYLYETIEYLLSNTIGNLQDTTLAKAFATASAYIPDDTPPDFGGFRLGDDIVKEKLALIIKGMSGFRLLTSFFHRQFFGFFIWYQSFVWSLLSLLGLVYWKNTPHGILTSSQEEQVNAFKGVPVLGFNRQTPKLLKNVLKKSTKKQK